MSAMPQQDGGLFEEAAAQRALAMASTNTLRVALYQATGDEELARMPVIDMPFWAGAYEVPVLDRDYDQRIREKAPDFLRAGEASRCETPDDTMLRSLMDMLAGRPVNDYLFSFGKEEANFTPFPRGVEWSAGKAPTELSDFHVVVIGAGAAGLVAGLHL
jgi:4-hydroxyacetophenone monooxygenase